MSWAFADIFTDQKCWQNQGKNFNQSVTAFVLPETEDKTIEKDVTEKLLEDYDDVFADIINGLLFEGEQVVKPGELQAGQPHSQYKADDGTIHEQERDVVKLWKKKRAMFAVYGIENQTKVERQMPLRIMGYDGASYRNQLLRKRKPVPVVSLVLYFGTEHWNQPKNLKELLEIPEGLEPYVNDYRVHVFEISWLSDEQVAKFKSDFKVVANFFVQKRKNRDYIPDDPTEIKHVDEVLKLLSVMAKDSRYEEIRVESKKGSVNSMCEVADRLWNGGKMEGLIEGEKKGLSEGENLLASLMEKLLELNRITDAMGAAQNAETRQQLYKEFGMV